MTRLNAPHPTPVPAQVPAPAESPSGIGPSFSQLPLPPATLANLHQLGYLGMTPIQAASLPIALAGHDLIAQAKTGSGKTAAFALAVLANLNVRRFAVQCPTGYVTPESFAFLPPVHPFHDAVVGIQALGVQGR